MSRKALSSGPSTWNQADGGGIIAHQAGQFLPIRVAVAGAPQPLQRTYTLSVAPSDQIYRISVMREGLVSTHLHTLQEGDLVETRAPAGTFTIDAAERRPVVLLAAGIGVTPVLAMLRHLVYEGRRTRWMRPTWVLYGARTLKERAFDAELADLVKRAMVRSGWSASSPRSKRRTRIATIAPAELTPRHSRPFFPQRL